MQYSTTGGGYLDEGREMYGVVGVGGVVGGVVGVGSVVGVLGEQYGAAGVGEEAFYSSMGAGHM